MNRRELRSRSKSDVRSSGLAKLASPTKRSPSSSILRTQYESVYQKLRALPGKAITHHDLDLCFIPRDLSDAAVETWSESMVLLFVLSDGIARRRSAAEGVERRPTRNKKGLDHLQNPKVRSGAERFCRVRWSKLSADTKVLADGLPAKS